MNCGFSWGPQNVSTPSPSKALDRRVPNSSVFLSTLVIAYALVKSHFSRMIESLFLRFNSDAPLSIHISSWPKRYKVTLMAFLGVFLMEILRANLSVAIIDMTSNKTVVVGNKIVLFIVSTIILISSYIILCEHSSWCDIYDIF